MKEKYSKLADLILILVWMKDLTCRNSRKWFSPMPYFWTKWGNVSRVLLWKICLRCIIPLLIHDVKFIGFLFIKKSGLFQRWVGAIAVLVIRWNSHQAVRVEAIVGFLKWNGLWTVDQKYGFLCIMFALCLSKSCQSDWDWSICGCIVVDGKWSNRGNLVLPDHLGILVFVKWLVRFWVFCFSNRILR